jgi:hypothetical protein
MATKKAKRKARPKAALPTPEPFPLPEPDCGQHEAKYEQPEELGQQPTEVPKPEIAVVKIEAPEPDERLIVLQVKGQPEHLPEPMLPEVPVEIEQTPLKKSFWQWLGL